MGVAFCGRGLNSLLNPKVHGGRMLSRARKKVSVLFKPQDMTQNQPRARAFPAASRTSLSAATWVQRVMQGRAAAEGPCWLEAPRWFLRGHRSLARARPRERDQVVMLNVSLRARTDTHMENVLTLLGRS